MTKRSAEKLFKVLDIYEALRDVLPTLDALLPDEAQRDEEASVIADPKTEVSSVQGRLGETTVALFCDLESSIKADNSKTPVRGGTIHPLTRYVMNYLKRRRPKHRQLEPVRNTIVGGDELALFESGYDVEVVQGSGAQQHLPDEQRALHHEEGEGVAVDPPAAGGDVVPEAVDGALEVPQELSAGDVVAGARMPPRRRLAAQGRRAEAGAQGEVQELQRRPMIEETHKTQSMWVVSDEQLQSELRVSVSAVVLHEVN
ncbi:hypothetical protein Cni_G16197 [Canna indica]|uniref:Exocyst subunit Exo70 family protein n=1 Tax=Canna indica TaxID=4628 RepID=A0AAQ3QFF8_9LILI|nr:hypothetical protein Cni_G16197 [Canna indica]